MKKSKIENNLQYLIFAALIALWWTNKIHHCLQKGDFVSGRNRGQCFGAGGDRDEGPHANHHQHVHPQHGGC